MATLLTQEARPEQSVPAGVSPPEMYGVPETDWTSAISDAVAIANMRPDVNSRKTGPPKYVTPFTIKIGYWLVHASLRSVSLSAAAIHVP
ncbi:hypothetical protein MMAGJ_65260 [Mycolicibacterium mageritense]|uniref:Uncharacterized protein n=1 Tax=Mycolicibacterium mageritense TaxID=53462 RepID=A0ABM7I2Y4_MYCME|nr:hypothetical protein MMAGJ_65260 [Mycolicibacterium mageritense]GJJ19147.1 hypothetical protein MTY414_28200 [Mycolicibacterium mageritense]